MVGSTPTLGSRKDSLMTTAMDKIQDAMDSYDLYHGTTSSSAKRLLQDGWQPGSGVSTGNRGNSRYLYLTNGMENAAAYAGQIGGDVVLRVRNVPKSVLKVDPEDGSHDTVEEELGSSMGLPGNVVAFRPIDAEAFEKVEVDPGYFSVE